MMRAGRWAMRRTPNGLSQLSGFDEDFAAMRAKIFSFIIPTVAVLATLGHLETVQALTAEETLCVSREYAEGNDPAACLNLGDKTGGGASSGSDSGSRGEAGDGGADGGKSATPPGTSATCTAPDYWFTGPVDPRAANISLTTAKSGGITNTLFTMKFRAAVGGKPYLFDRSFMASDDGTGTVFAWSVTSVQGDGSLGIPIVHTCVD